MNVHDADGAPRRSGRVAMPDFDALVEQAVVGVYVVQNERLVYANPRLAALFGYTVPELLDLPNVLTLVAEHDRPIVKEMIRRRLTGEVEAVRYTWCGRRRDGSTIDVEVLSGRSEWDGRPAISGTILDITERRREEEALRLREGRLRQLFERARDVVFSCDLDGRLTSINQTGERLLGITPGQPIADAVIEGHRPRALEMMRQAQREPAGSRHELSVRATDGQCLTFEVAVQLHAPEDRAAEILGIARDITSRKLEEEALRSLTLVDELTGLYNRRGFQTLAERHLQLALRKQRGVFLLFCDVDGLKNINDTYGHLEGDRALVDAAAILRHSFRSADIIARFGGDEFTVFPLEAADESGTLLVRRLEDNISTHNAAAGRVYRLKMSVGIARFEPESAWSVQQLLEAADRHLYAIRRTRT
jgi:diguanylate cyclase (GGDEF)-like protein/PAS domain S-box-containing protein